MGWHTTMRKAKAKHRPELDDWECDGLYEVFPSYVNGLSDDYEAFIPSQQHGSSSSSGLHASSSSLVAKNSSVNNGSSGATPSTMDAAAPAPPTVIPEEIPIVLNAETLTPQQFATDYEAKKVPVVIRNIPNGHDGGKEAAPWIATQRWGFFNLENDPELRERPFKCGEDDDGNSVKIKMKHFLKYLQNNKDDSPLYIFDSAFEDDRVSKKILRDYKVPSYFKEDLFRLCSENRRPPYRWFLVGPERSGTSVHIDPLATSAWNTLIHGQKRWVLFPPHVPKSVVKGKDLIRDDEDDEPIHYFMYILPRIKRKAAAACFCNGSQPQGSDYKDFACYEFTQNPGETVFIPNGWWHAVLNVSHTVGITQNFCSSQNFDEVWMKTRTGRKRLAWKWLCQLEVRYPHLAKRAKALNKRDKFIMKYDPVVMEWRRQEEESREQKRSWHKRGEKDNSKGDKDDGEGKEGEEKEGDGRSLTTTPPQAKMIKVAYDTITRPPQLSHLDRSWKRSQNSATKSRPVSPP